MSDGCASSKATGAAASPFPSTSQQLPTSGQRGREEAPSRLSARPGHGRCRTCPSRSTRSSTRPTSGPRVSRGRTRERRRRQGAAASRGGLFEAVGQQRVMQRKGIVERLCTRVVDVRHRLVRHRLARVPAVHRMLLRRTLEQQILVHRLAGIPARPREVLAWEPAARRRCGSVRAIAAAKCGSPSYHRITNISTAHQPSAPLAACCALGDLARSPSAARTNRRAVAARIAGPRVCLLLRSSVNMYTHTLESRILVPRRNAAPQKKRVSSC